MRIAQRIEDYAMIGDTHTAALVSRSGSIDWLCLPRFDSGACFAALLGTEEHGRWLLAPSTGVRRTERRYRDETLVLETTHQTDDGEVRVIDCMPPRGREADVVRIVEGVRGQVAMTMDLAIRFDYGSIVPWVRRTDLGIRAVAGPDSIEIRTPVELHGKDMRTSANFVVSEGESVPFALIWHPSHESPPAHLDPMQAVEQTESFWREWAGRCAHEGEWREAVVRSLITLKALTYAPTGGIVAAATTSLPETLGGERNWDYRLCWLRDATFTLYSLLQAGYRDEATSWRDWLLRAVAGEPSELQILYGLAGERRLPELEVPWLPGYAGSQPVRIGNAAYEQFQLDVYGEVLELLYQAEVLGMSPEGPAWNVQRAIMDFLESAWDRPDDGIWEIRGHPRHFTHSKVMAWVGVDRAIRHAERFGHEAPLDRWRPLREAIHRQVCRDGYDTDLGSFVQYYGSKRLDASLLMIPLVGFLPPEDERVVGTVSAIERDLSHDGLIQRYRPEVMVEGVGGEEGAFLACTFWLADCYALMSRTTEARALFEHLLSLRNDVGLLSEEYDPVGGRMLGNFPQAFSHVSLIDTARNLSRGVLGPVEQRRAAATGGADGG